jgi:hypothetical protein
VEGGGNAKLKTGKGDDVHFFTCNIWNRYSLCDVSQ